LVILQEVSIGDNEPTCKKKIELLGCIDEDIGVRGSSHSQFLVFVVLFVLSSGKNFKFLHTKKEAQEAFDDKIN
jgi:hypothetical protein